MACLFLNNIEVPDIDLIVFDKDGTLIDVHQYWAAMIAMRTELICERLGLDKSYQQHLMDRMGVDINKNKIKPEGPVGIKKREIVMQAAIDYLLSIGQPNRTDLCADVFREVDLISVNHLDRIITPITGIYSLFADIMRTSCKIAIATTDLTERAKLAMSHLGLLDSIDMVAGADMVEKNKPHPEMIDLILESLNIPREKAVMVGDAITDVQMGAAAGLRASIGVASGLTAAADLLAITPFVIPDIANIEIRQ